MGGNVGGRAAAPRLFDCVGQPVVSARSMGALDFGAFRLAVQARTSACTLAARCGLAALPAGGSNTAGAHSATNGHQLWGESHANVAM